MISCGREIAEELSISRSYVSQLLSYAKETGMTPTAFKNFVNIHEIYPPV